MQARTIKWLIKFPIVVMLSVIVLGVAGYIFVDQYVDRYVKKKIALKIEAIPAGYAEQSFAPYTGPHPSTLDRNFDSFLYPIQVGGVGPQDPLFSGAHQYPFICGTFRAGLGQPLIDNYDGIGTPVYKDLERGVVPLPKDLLGYSKDCVAPTKVFYYYNPKGTELFFPWKEDSKDIAKVMVNGREVDFIVRVEMGVINRFVYGIAAIKGTDEVAESPQSDNWNQRLVYQFRGGVGIGFKQGKLRAGSFLKRRYRELKRGYAVATSTANQTSNHYNMWISEEVMMRVKNQFSALYGKPVYTVGIGGSGGAIQQMVLAQNHPGLLDGIVALYAYPDMISQTVYAYECEPLEYYFDAIDNGNEKWHRWENRSLIEGLNAKSDFEHPLTHYVALARAVNGIWPPWPEGSTECVVGWRGLTQLTNNPKYIHFERHFSNKVLQKTHWTHWEDLKAFYGKPAHGFANASWDNVGVQYGLEALVNQQIGIKQFLQINAQVGGWKTHESYRQERFWKFVDDTSVWDTSVWGQHNMNHGNIDRPAKRTHGSVDAIRAAFLSGHVFMGKVDVPVIDLRHYLEDELDMHHLSASFSIRQRMLNAMGHHTNHVVWVARKPHIPTDDAFDVLDEWILAQQQHPQKSVIESRPLSARDQCWGEQKNIVASGESVWDGEWNNKPVGACLNKYPMYKNSRMVAGDSIEGDNFKCHLQSIEKAVAEGVYGDGDMNAHLDVLKKIFPEGVCDYRKPSQGLPTASEFANGLGEQLLVDALVVDRLVKSR